MLLPRFLSLHYGKGGKCNLKGKLPFWALSDSDLYKIPFEEIQMDGAVCPIFALILYDVLHD